MKRRALLAVLAAATAARLLTYIQIHEGPALHLHVWSQSDMSFFDRWAHAIADGDVLTKADMRPYHGWQRDLACEAIKLRSTRPADCSDAAVAKMWDRWVGRATFWQDPLYPYLLALVYGTVGSSADAVYALQAAAGIACAWLVYSITLSLFGVGAALLAGIGAALYGPLMFFETLRLREVAITLASLAAVRAAMAAVATERAWRWLGAGLTAGLSVLLKASGMMYAVALPAIVAWRDRDHPRRAAWAAAAFTAGFAIAMSPLVVRNLAVGVAPFSVASTGALNFLNGNAEDYRPGPGVPISRHALTILASSGGGARAVVDATLATHPRRGEWLSLLGRKLAAFWRAAEIPDNASWRYFLLQAPWLRCAAGFGLVAPFALLGFVVGLRRNPAAWIALLNVAAGVAVCVLFFDLARFRLPAAIGMLPFAGFAMVWLVESVRARRLVSAVAGAALVVLAAAFVNAPDDSGATDIRIADFGVHNAISVHLAGELERTGDLEGAMCLLERQLRTEPDELRAIEPSPSPTHISPKLSGVAGTFVPLHARAARLAERLGRQSDATYHQGRTMVLETLNAPYVAANPPAANVESKLKAP